jgi:hypothetical protein
LAFLEIAAADALFEAIRRDFDPPTCPFGVGCRQIGQAGTDLKSSLSRFERALRDFFRHFGDFDSRAADFHAGAGGFHPISGDLHASAAAGHGASGLLHAAFAATSVAPGLGHPLAAATQRLHDVVSRASGVKTR